MVEVLSRGMTQAPDTTSSCKDCLLYNPERQLCKVFPDQTEAPCGIKPFTQLPDGETLAEALKEVSGIWTQDSISRLITLIEWGSGEEKAENQLKPGYNRR